MMSSAAAARRRPGGDRNRTPWRLVTPAPAGSGAAVPAPSSVTPVPVPGSVRAGHCAQPAYKTLGAGSQRGRRKLSAQSPPGCWLRLGGPRLPSWIPFSRRVGAPPSAFSAVGADSDSPARARRPGPPAGQIHTPFPTPRGPPPPPPATRALVLAAGRRGRLPVRALLIGAVGPAGRLPGWRTRSAARRRRIAPPITRAAPRPHTRLALMPKGKTAGILPRPSLPRRRVSADHPGGLRPHPAGPGGAVSAALQPRGVAAVPAMRN